MLGPVLGCCLVRVENISNKSAFTVVVKKT